MEISKFVGEELFLAIKIIASSVLLIIFIIFCSFADVVRQKYYPDANFWIDLITRLKYILATILFIISFIKMLKWDYDLLKR